MRHISEDSTLHLNHDRATVSTVLDALDQHNWVHLACHGLQDASDPLKSGFALHDGRLELKSLMTKSLDHAQMAFLSACQTAKGDDKLPEEAVHLAAGMLTAGFPSAVATMWSIGDDDACIVAEAFYSIMAEKRHGSEELEVAYALHEAVKQLLDKVGEKNFVKWVPFVHYGL
ncbi:hypothetical protein M422DRAFT_261486 [Sphaerobolus stellatus SS14]|uniref:CHAT domain-containing protein n=1 Tax=Sphaerobolus stellatus (strain SS14) TaxID=990650 RepID=A0A0C9U087_SPHS4|nr:hypothetical protein M422DRAFT_261486 [Sphaerobolus stellatus SS14]